MPNLTLMESRQGSYESFTVVASARGLWERRGEPCNAAIKASISGHVL